MRTAMLVLSVLSIVACGGGGGGGGGGSDTPPLTVDQSAQVAQTVLEECGAAQVDTFLAELGPVQELLDGTAAVEPDFQVTSLDLIQARVGWTADLDLDGTVDLSGTTQILNAAGNPTWPIDFAALLAGNLTIDQVLAAMPDGTQLLFDVTTPDQPQVNADLAAVINANTVDTVTGSGTVTNGGCVSTYDLGTLTLGDLQTEYPSAVFDLSILGASGSVDGDITLDGTTLAVAAVEVNGGQGMHTFEVDLETGTVTPR